LQRNYENSLRLIYVDINLYCLYRILTDSLLHQVQEIHFHKLNSEAVELKMEIKIHLKIP